MAGAARSTALRFHGPPYAAEAVVHRPVAGPVSAHFDGLEPVAVMAAPLAGATVVRLTLPESTPPGSYQGTVDAGGVTYPATVAVEPTTDLALTPARLAVAGPPGGTAEVTVWLSNRGNVGVEVAGTHAAGLFATGGADRAMGAALRASGTDGAGRLAHLLEGLASAHAGLLKIRLGRGAAGTLEPGETRELPLRLALPEALVPGRTYTATWPLANLHVAVRVTATAPEGDQPGRKAGATRTAPASKPGARMATGERSGTPPPERGAGSGTRGGKASGRRGGAAREQAGKRADEREG